MKKFKHITLLLCSVFALSLVLSCSNDDDDDNSEPKIEKGTEYKSSSGTQVYRMVTKKPNLSSAGDLVKVWYYDDKDALVYYSEEDTEYFDNAATGTYNAGTVTSYTDETKSAMFGKEVSTTGDTVNGGNYILDEDYDGNGNKTTSKIKVYDFDEDGLPIGIECEYDPNKTEKNVIKYAYVTMNGTDFHDIVLTEYYAKNLTWNPSTLEVTGDLLAEKQVAYRYDESKTVKNGIFDQPLCIGYITTTTDYDESTLAVLKTTYTETEYRWNTALYKDGPLEEITYNLEYIEDGDIYRTVEQCGYKIIQVEEFDGEMLPIQEIWFTSEGNIQYKYVYDYDVDPLVEVIPNYFEKYGTNHYMTKKSFYQNSSTGLFLAESSEILRYNSGENNEYCYEVEIHKTYDKL